MPLKQVQPRLISEVVSPTLFDSVLIQKEILTKLSFTYTAYITLSVLGGNLN